MANSGEEFADPSDIDAGEGDNGPSKPRYLFTIDGDHPDRVLPLVCDLVRDAAAELIICSPVNLPEQTPLEAPEPNMEGRRAAAQFALKAQEQCEGISVHQDATAGHGRDGILRDVVDRYNVSTLISEDQPRSGIRSFLGFATTEEAALPDECDTIIVPRVAGSDDIDSILVPVAGGPHSGYAVEAGLAVARQNDAAIELLHVSSEGDEEGRLEGEEILRNAMTRLEEYNAADDTLHEAEEVPESILEYSQPFDVSVFGAPREGMLRQFMLGSVPESVAAETDGTVLIAHRGGASESWLDRLI